MPMRNDIGAFNRDLDASADLLRDLVLQAPPNLTGGGNLRTLGELLKAGRFGNRLRRLSTENLQHAVRPVHEIGRRLSRRLV